MPGRRTPASRDDASRREFEEALRAVQLGAADVIRVTTAEGERLFTREGAEHPYRMLVDQMGEGAAMLSVDGIILYANRRLAEIAGIPCERLVGSEAALLLDEAGRDRLAAGLARRDGVRTAFEGRLNGPRPEGTPVRISIGFVPGEQHPQFGLTVVDLTEAKNRERELVRIADALEGSNRELEQFAYMASHDLQEPLRQIGSYAALLAEEYQGRLDPDADTYIGFVVDAARRMQELVRDLLQLSRVGTQGKPLRPINMTAACAEAVRNLERAAAESGAVIHLQPLPTVEGDWGQVVQLFQNLIGNAIKFRREGPPTVRIGATPAGNSWTFHVEDDGIGFDQEQAGRIFEMFQRLHTRDRFDGNGMGLAIAKRIVERHGGRIWATSTPGAGSRFCFTLGAGQADA